MPRLPVLSGEELIKTLQKAGFQKVRQVSLQQDLGIKYNYK